MKKLLSLALLLLPLMAAAQTYQYIDANGKMQTTSGTVTVINGTNIATLNNLNGWYLVRGDLVRNSTLNISGNAHIILENGSDLKVNGSSCGINILDNASLNIYAQSTGSAMGKLTASGASNGIWGFIGTITINGGTVTAIGNNNWGGNGQGIRIESNSAIAINGGIVTANNSTGHGIYGSEITINGGTVTGGSISGVDVTTISGGIVTAIPTNNEGGGGIGGSTVTISGGIVTAIGGGIKAGIGGKLTLDGDAIVLASTVKGIDEAYEGQLDQTLKSGILFISGLGILNAIEGSPVTVRFPQGVVATWERQDGKSGIAYAGGGKKGFMEVSGITFIERIPYIDENGIKQTTSSTVTVIDETNIATIDNLSGWFLVRGNLERSKTLNISGDAHIILEDGSSLEVRVSNYGTNAWNGINAENVSLNIYAQSTGTTMGKLTAIGYGNYSYGIYGGEIAISGGEVTAMGYYNYGIYGSKITISGGEVTVSGNYSNGIYGGEIAISGGTVTANVGNYGDGTRYGIYGSEITISGGEVTATGGMYNCYSGSYGSSYGIYGSKVTISGGEVVTAINCYGIYGSEVTISGGEVIGVIYGSEVTISDGEVMGGVSGTDTVTITGGEVTGSIYGGSNSTITISGGTVTARGHAARNGMSLGASIYGDSNSKITISGGTVTTSGGSNDAQYGISGSTITISDGTVTATGSSRGICSESGTITISGGEVTATGNSSGIYGSTIISGGTVTAIGNSSGISGSYYGTIITITGGTVTAIGSGSYGISVPALIKGGAVFANSVFTTPTFESGIVFISSITGTIFESTPISARFPLQGVAATWERQDSKIGIAYASEGKEGFIEIPGVTLIERSLDNVPYIDENGKAQIANNVGVIDETNIGTINNLGGWLLVRGNFEYNSTLNISCDTHIILEDGSSLEVNESSSGIYVSASGSLNIYAQSTGAAIGKLTATGSSYGIYGRDNSTITISGGEVTASGTYSYGIYSENGTITISGGTVTASGSSYGIYGSTGSTITISGGTVTASGSSYGIYGSTGSTITISGGTVIASSANSGRTIGISGTEVTINGGEVIGNISGSNSYSKITISGGTVTASEIYGSTGNTITISGGTVTASEIYGSTGNTITISGGMVTVNGSSYGISGRLDGNAIVFVNSTYNNITRTNGILFQGYSGNVYGNVELPRNLEIKNYYTLNLNEGTLAIPSGITLTNNGTITNNNNYSYSYSTITNNGTVVNNGAISNGYSSTVTNNGTITNYRTITNSGTIDNNGTISNGGTITNNRTISNRGTIANDGTITNNSGEITNNGTITNSGKISNSGTITNSGTVTVNGGTLTGSKIRGSFGTLPDLNETYAPSLTLADIPLPAEYTWNNPRQYIYIGDGQTFEATRVYNSEHETATGNITVNVGKAEPDYTIPTGLTATYGQTLADVELPYGWEWMNVATVVGEAGTQTHKAKYTPYDTYYYNVVTDIDLQVTVSESTPILPPQIATSNASSNILAHTSGNSIILQNLPANAKVDVYDLKGKLISRKSFNQVNQGSDMSIPMQTKGMYIVKVSSGNEKKTVKVAVRW